MNLNEFKAWFEGFTDGIDSNPTEKQWEKIKTKVSEIKAEPTSPLVIREYINNYRRYWNEPVWYEWFQPYATYLSGVQVSNSAGSTAGNLSAQAMTAMYDAKPVEGDIEKDFGYTEAAFRAMGAADAAALNG